MKKILLDAYYAENLGDDLFIKIIVERYPNVKWYIVTFRNEYKHNFVSRYKNVKVIKLPRIISILKTRINLINRIYMSILMSIRLDGIVKIGGSIFMQYSGWKNRYNDRFKLWFFLKKRKKKVFIIGSNFGPFEEQEFLSSYERLFTKIDDICFRDEYSYNLFKSLPNVRLAPDVVFALQENQAMFKRKTIGISVISLDYRPNLKKYNEMYLNKMIEMVNELGQMGYEITLFSFCKREGDEDVIKSILNKCDNRENVDHHFYNGDVSTSLAIFSSMEYIVSCRFHSLILAYIMNKPVFPIIYSDKTSNVIKDLGIEQKMYHVKEIDEISLEDVFEIISNPVIISSSIRESAEKQFSALDEFLKG